MKWDLRSKRAKSRDDTKSFCWKLIPWLQMCWPFSPYTDPFRIQCILQITWPLNEILNSIYFTILGIDSTDIEKYLPILSENLEIPIIAMYVIYTLHKWLLYWDIYYVLLKYLDLFNTNIISCSYSMVSKQNPAPLMLECSMLFQSTKLQVWNLWWWLWWLA